MERSVRDKIASLIDYRGDIARNSQSNDSPNQYHSDYSPNNIKTVIISPDGVAVKYHCSVKGLPSFNMLRFQALALNKDEADLKYKPILNLLAERVCSSVEEIIILTDSVVSAFDTGLYLKESDISGMLRGKALSSNNLTEEIKNRYGRLRYFTTLHGVVFENLIRLKDIRSSSFISDLDILNPYIRSKVVLNEEDEWWKHWGNQSVYRFDKEVLSPHFTKIKEKNESLLKASKIEAVRNERVSTEIKELNQLVSVYNKLFEAVCKFNNTVRVCGSNGLIADNNTLNITFKPLISYSGMPKINSHLIDSKDMPTEEAIKYNKEIVKNAKSMVVDNLSEFLISALHSIKDEVSIAILMRGTETTVIVPASCETMMLEIKEKSGVSFDGTNTTVSIINTMWLYCMFFLDRGSERYRSEYITREYWEKEVRL